jgi:ATP-binding cassette subfamily B protein
MFKVLLRNPIAHLTIIMWKHAEGSRRWVVLYSVMAVLAIMVSLLAPLIMAKVLDAVQRLHGDELISFSTQYLGIYLSIGVAFWFLHGPSRVIETVMGFHVKRAFQMALFHKVTSLPMSWQKSHHSGETIDQIAKASSALEEFTTSGFEVIHLITRFVGAVAVLTWLMPWAGVAVITLGILAATVIVLFDRALVKQYSALNKSFNGVAASIQDYLTNVATVISLRLEGRVAREISERTNKIRPLWRSNSILGELKWFTTSRFVDLTHAGVLLGFIIIMVKRGAAIEIGTMYALSEYLRSIGDSFFQFTGKYGDLIVRSTRVHNIDHIEEAYDREVSATEHAKLPESWRTLEISGLTFSHKENEEAEHAPGVHNISFALERGKSYAFVGESGSGKSTVLKLIRGLHRPERGVVHCDGTKLPDGMSHVAHHSTLIPQDPEIFADTIRFNVTMGIDAPEEKILWALERARFSHVLARLPKGLDTNIAEKGVSLSGGEKQRLAVARGLFFVKESASDIILLDEPTSSVDIFNERLIYEGLLKEFRSYCVVTAIHKFNLLHLFDEVVVFAGGRLVERGSVQKLLSQKGEFFRLWENFRGEGEARQVV